MTEFHPLKVKEIQKTTEDCSIITFDVPESLQSDFSFKQGQYLTLEAKINGEDVRRSYSLCSSPIENTWSVGIKKIEDGKFSTYANDVLAVGDTIQVMKPMGHFFTELKADNKKQYIAFAAGSGITPIASIIKTVLSVEPNSTFKLFFINKNAQSIILKEELEGLKNLHLDKFEIFHFLTKQQRILSFQNGRLDIEKMDVIFNTICNAEDIDDVFSCGPEAMVLMIRDYLVKKGMAKNKIHFELFHAEGATIEVKEKIEKQHKGLTSEITILEGGRNTKFTMERGSDNLLDASLNNAADLPFACKGGVCCTCRAKLIEGDVEVLLNYGLEDDEIEEGYILTCQSIPTSEKVVVDFDA